MQYFYVTLGSRGFELTKIYLEVMKPAVGSTCFRFPRLDETKLDFLVLLFKLFLFG